MTAISGTPIVPVVVAALLAIGVGGCGAAQTRKGTASSSSHGARPLASFPVDQDRDARGEGYYDGDDGPIRYHGHAAGPADTRAIETLLARYYAAAAADDGTRACALTYYFEAESLPEEYGGPPGPRWLHGANTCRAVLTRVFRHFHSQLTAPVTVTAVRVHGDRADALVGFRELPAGVVSVRREGAVWKIDGLLAVALP